MARLHGRTAISMRGGLTRCGELDQAAAEFNRGSRVILPIAITVLAAVAFATSLAMAATSMTMTTTTMPSRAGTG